MIYGGSSTKGGTFQKPSIQGKWCPPWMESRGKNSPMGNYGEDSSEGMDPYMKSYDPAFFGDLLPSNSETIQGPQKFEYLPSKRSQLPIESSRTILNPQNAVRSKARSVNPHGDRLADLQPPSRAAVRSLYVQRVRDMPQIQGCTVQTRRVVRMKLPRLLRKCLIKGDIAWERVALAQNRLHPLNQNGV